MVIRRKETAYTEQLCEIAHHLDMDVKELLFSS